MRLRHRSWLKNSQRLDTSSTLHGGVILVMSVVLLASMASAVMLLAHLRPHHYNDSPDSSRPHDVASPLVIT